MSQNQPCFRLRLYRQLAPEAAPDGKLSAVNRTVVWIILLSVVLGILSTEDSLVERWPEGFFWANLFIGGIFTIEYLARVWTAVENPAYRGFTGRLRYMRTPLAVIDMVVLVPFYLAGAWGDLFILRLIRVLRILALLRLGRYSRALRAIGRSLAKRQFEVYVSITIAGAIMFAAATGMYLLEGTTQPEAFGSIPRALWWAVVTLTTVGYGDVFPITVLGKAFAALAAVAGVGLIALPAGILAGAFSEVFSQQDATDLQERVDQ